MGRDSRIETRNRTDDRGSPNVENERRVSFFFDVRRKLTRFKFIIHRRLSFSPRSLPQSACPTTRLVLCGECDEHTRASAKGAPRASLRAFALADDPDSTAPDAFGARYPADARSASRHPFREGIYLYPECDNKEFRQKSEGSGDGQGSGGAEDETNPKDGARSTFRAGAARAGDARGGQKNAGGAAARMASTVALGSRPGSVNPGGVPGVHGPANPVMMAPFQPPLAGFPAGAPPPYHAQGEWQELLRQGSVGDGALPLGARFFPHAPGSVGMHGGNPGLHGLNRLGSNSSNGSDPIGMYMNFDGNVVGSNLGGSGSGGDLAGQAGGGGSNGSPAREMGSHQEVTSDVAASMWMHPYAGYPYGGYPGQARGNPGGPFPGPQGVPGAFAPFPAEAYAAPGYHAMQQSNPYFAEPIGAFAPTSSGYPAMQQPAMHDQIHRVGAAPPRPPSAATQACSPYQHTAGGATTMLPRDGGNGGSPGTRDDVPNAGAHAGVGPVPVPMQYPRGGTGGGVPASSWSTEATHAAQYHPAAFAPGSFYDGGAPPVAGVIGAPGGLVRMERNSQGSIGGGGGSGGNGMSGGGGSVVAVSSLVNHGYGHQGYGSHEFLVGARGHPPSGGSDGEDAARGAPHGRALDPNDEIRAAAGSMAPGTKAREEMLVRYHKKRKERHFKKKIRYASRKVRADNRVRIKGRFARADAPLVAIDKSSAKNHRDIRGDAPIIVKEDAEETAHDAHTSESDSEAEDDEPAPVGKRTRRGAHAVSKGNSKGAATAMTGVSELATPDVPPGACA
jgi:hypothetical protein